MCLKHNLISHFEAEMRNIVLVTTQKERPLTHRPDDAVMYKIELPEYSTSCVCHQ